MKLFDKLKNVYGIYKDVRVFFDVGLLLVVAVILFADGYKQIQLRNNYNPQVKIKLYVHDIVKEEKFIILSRYKAMGHLLYNNVKINTEIDISFSEENVSKKDLILTVYPHRKKTVFIHSERYDDTYLSITILGFFVPGQVLFAIAFFLGIPLVINYDKIQKKSLEKDSPYDFIILILIGTGGIILNNIYFDDKELLIYSIIAIGLGFGLLIFQILEFKFLKE